MSISGYLLRTAARLRHVPVVLVFAVSGLAASLMPAPGQAQTASAVTPDSFQPQLQRLNGTLVFSGEAGTQAPPGADQIGITLSGVNIDGALPALEGANRAFQSRLTRGRVPVSELFEATAALEQAYANAGFVLARVVLPQQSLRDGGVLRVQVVNGFVETVDSESVPPAVRARLQALTAPLVSRPGITLAELERQLLLAGDAAGVALNTALGAGSRPGATVLALEAQFRRITGFIGADNFAGTELGRPVVNAGVEVNSALGLAETFYARLTASRDRAFGSDPRYRVGALGLLMPLGNDGLTVNVELTESRTGPEGDDADTRSRFSRQSVRLIYPVIRSRDVNLTTQLVLDRQSDRQRLLTTAGALPIYEDRLTVLRFGVNGSLSHADGGFSEGGITLSRGLDALSARGPGGEPPLSRQEAGPEFTSIGISGRHQRKLGEALTLTVLGRAQTSLGDALLTSEQFSATGANALSSFDAGAIRGDSGYVIRAELAMPRAVTIAGRQAQVSPYVFAAAGAVDLAAPTAFEVDREKATAVGLGIDLLVQGATPFRADSIRVEFGKGNRDNGDDDTRFGLSGNFRF